MKKTDNIKYRWESGSHWNLPGGSKKWNDHFIKRLESFFTKLTYLVIWSQMPLLGIYAEEMKTFLVCKEDTYKNIHRSFIDNSREYPSKVNGCAHCAIPTWRSIFSNKKKWPTDTWCWTKETRHGREPDVRFHLYDLVEQAERIYGDRERSSCCLGLGLGVGTNCKVTWGNFLGWWKCSTFWFARWLFGYVHLSKFFQQCT